MDKLENPPGGRGGVPLHKQIAEELRRQIVSGDLGPGDRLPSEHVLMGRFGVSRGTIRQAMGALRADGTIAGSQGRRFTINRAPLTQPLSELISFSAWAESLGKRPSGIVVESGYELADAESAEALGISPGDHVYRIIRVRLADEVPLMIERTAFVESLGRHLSEIDLARQSIYAELAKRGVTFQSARHLLSAYPAGRIDAQQLGVAAGAPLLRVLRTGYSPAGKPLEWSDDRYRGDDVEFAIDNSIIVSGVARRMEQAGGS